MTGPKILRSARQVFFSEEEWGQIKEAADDAGYKTRSSFIREVLQFVMTEKAYSINIVRAMKRVCGGHEKLNNIASELYEKGERELRSRLGLPTEGGALNQVSGHHGATTNRPPQPTELEGRYKVFFNSVPPQKRDKEALDVFMIYGKSINKSGAFHGPPEVLFVNGVPHYDVNGAPRTMNDYQTGALDEALTAAGF